ncbi:ImmA/IrrE family metallo-endopeptidase [Listeria goaensis]|uniref:ImmA/IrrE family metallo-endopeptidase n=1 Tax=Listeria goaensis TaxID=1649188 RepID=UPI000B596BE6|nr:ImmA/IrrE family metallo-endopeptidase [Listeria goaensis]
MDAKEVAAVVTSNYMMKTNTKLHGYMVENCFRDIFYQQNVDYIYKDMHEKRLGIIMKDEMGITIGVNSKFPSRKTFSTAHEIGHLFLDLPNHEISTFSDDIQSLEQKTNNLQIERNANTFASYLICPEKVLEYYFQEGVSFFDIALRLKMSFESLKWRIYHYIQNHFNYYKNKILQIVENFFELSKRDRQKLSYLYNEVLKIDFSMYARNKKLLNEFQ